MFTWAILAGLASLANGTAQEFDLLLRGGHVMDAKNRIDGLRDVAIKAGKIAAVEAKIDPGAGVPLKNKETPVTLSTSNPFCVPFREPDATTPSPKVYEKLKTAPLAKLSVKQKARAMRRTGRRIVFIGVLPPNSNWEASSQLTR